MNDFFIRTEKDNLIINGDGVSKLKARHNIFLERQFSAQIDSNEIIIYDVSSKENLVSDIIQYFKKQNFECVFSKDISSGIERQIQEEEAFEKFSLEAKKIWNNEFNLDDFDIFQKKVSNSMKRILYPLQLLSAYHLSFSQNAANFSVPGAGKTSIVYGAFAYLSSINISAERRVDKLLVIGPLSSFGPWESEYEECFGESSHAMRISGNTIDSNTKKKYFFSNETSILTLISYQGILSQKENIEYFLKNNDVMVVLDEAHKIKNTNGGKIAETILAISKYCKSRVVLTGTPAPNGYQDLYNLFKFIWPTKKIIKYNLYQLEDMNSNEKLDSRQLINDISPYFVRIKKDDLSLPPKIEHQPIIVRMDDKQQEIYNFIAKDVIEELDEVSSDDNSIVIQIRKAKLIRMMQAASNPALLQKPLISEYGEEFNGEYLMDFDRDFVNKINYYTKVLYPNKFYKALEIIKKIINDGGKVIVWAIYIDTVERFNIFLEENGLNSKILYGKTPIETNNTDQRSNETREKIIKEFHNVECDYKVIIANPFAVAESISLHKACHNAIYLEKNFDAARFVQSKDRIHRYGLSDDIVTNYYYLVSENSIEETIHTRLLEKEERMIQIMESKDIPLFLNLKDEFENDVKAVIRDYVNQPK